MSGELSTVTPSPVELVNPGLPDDLATLDREELAEKGRTVVQFAEQIEEAKQWVLGDLACEVETRYGDEDMRIFATEIGVYYHTLRGYAATSAAFPRGSVGRQTHSYGVYQTLAAQEDRLELVSAERMTVAQARQLVEKRDTNARRNAARAANKAKKAAEAAKEAEKAAKKASTRKRTTATPPEPDPAPPAPQPRQDPGRDSTDDQRQYLGRDSLDDPGPFLSRRGSVIGWPAAAPDGQRAPHPMQWSIYGSAAKSMLDAVEQGRVPTAEELAQLREALGKVEALAAVAADVDTAGEVSPDEGPIDMATEDMASY